MISGLSSTASRTLFRQVSLYRRGVLRSSPSLAIALQARSTTVTPLSDSNKPRGAAGGHWPVGLGLGALALYSTTNNEASCEAPAVVVTDKKSPRIVRSDDLGRRDLFPPIDAYKTGRLKVSAIHEIYYEESGNPKGKPVVFLHGGPGGGSSPDFRRYFDPKAYRIIVFDQRGCGQSTPHANLEENTTWDLVEDVERLRKHLGIEKWQVFGGSWGSTLALAYAQEHPTRVTELVLRGIFMLRQKELRFYYQEGSSWIYPDVWEDYYQHIPPDERSDMIAAYNKRLTSKDEKTRLEAARQWTRWEMATSKLFPDLSTINKANEDKFKADDQLLRNINRIRHIPCIIVQGRYDVVCPVRSAFDLFRAWPESDLVIVQDAGHSAAEVGIRSELIKATEKFKSRK